MLIVDANTMLRPDNKSKIAENILKLQWGRTEDERNSL